jgi:hypothetical protein
MSVLIVMSFFILLAQPLLIDRFRAGDCKPSDFEIKYTKRKTGLQMKNLKACYMLLNDIVFFEIGVREK